MRLDVSGGDVRTESVGPPSAALFAGGWNSYFSARLTTRPRPPHLGIIASAIAFQSAQHRQHQRSSFVPQTWTSQYNVCEPFHFFYEYCIDCVGIITSARPVPSSCCHLRSRFIWLYCLPASAAGYRSRRAKDRRQANDDRGAYC